MLALIYTSGLKGGKNGKPKYTAEKRAWACSGVEKSSFNCCYWK